MSERKVGFPWVGVALVAAAATLPYLVAIRAPFVFDDQVDIIDNAAIHDLWPPTWASGTRPFASLTFALNWAIGGESAVGFRIVNVLIHALAALTLRALVVRIAVRPEVPAALRNRAEWIGTAAAVLWAAHPLHTSAVSYVVHRYESLASLLCLVALYLLVGAHDARGRRLPWIAALGAVTVLACLTKEIAVMLPVAALLIDRAFLSGSTRQALQRNLALHAVIWASAGAAIAVVLGARSESDAIDAARSSQGFHLVELTTFDYARSELAVVARYLRLVVWPRELFIDYSDWPIAHRLADVMPVALVTLGAVAGSIVLLVLAPRVGTLACWFFLWLAPTSTIVPLFGELVAERRLYLALAGPAVLVACALALLAERSSRVLDGRVASVVSAAMALALGTACTLRNAQYRRPVDLFGHDAHTSPKNARACQNFAAALWRDGQRLPALEEYRRCIQIDPSAMGAYAGAISAARELGLSNPWAGDGRAEPAIVESNRAAAARSIANADARLQRGDRRGAIALLRQAAAIDPYSAAANGRLAILLGLDPDITPDSASEATVAGLRSWAINGSLDALVGAAIAASLAVNGHFDAAATMATQLIHSDEASGLTDLASDQRQARDLYRAKKRWIPRGVVR